MKTENLAIAMGAIVEQMLRIYNDEKETNQQLYTMGTNIGNRLADEFTSRACSFLSPAETTKKMLMEIAQQFMGMKLELTNESIKFEKKFHYYDLEYTLRQKELPKSMLSLCEDLMEEMPGVRIENLPAGLLMGVLETMNISGEIETKRVSGDIIFQIAGSKPIKQED